MADIELVIKIPEDVFKRTVFYREFRDLNDCVTTIKALEKAVFLPKGHGRLIDVDALSGELVCTHDGNYECERVCSCADCPESEYQCYTDINDAPTIIEADKAE